MYQWPEGEPLLPVALLVDAGHAPSYIAFVAPSACRSPLLALPQLLRAKGAKDLAPPPRAGETWGGNSPIPDVVVMADEGTLTKLACATDCLLFFCDSATQGRGPGFRSGPAYLGSRP